MRKRSASKLNNLMLMMYPDYMLHVQSLACTDKLTRLFVLNALNVPVAIIYKQPSIRLRIKRNGVCRRKAG